MIQTCFDFDQKPQVVKKRLPPPLEKSREYQRKSRAKNREKVRARGKIYQAKNRERINAYAREYAAEKPAITAKAQKNYRKKNPFVMRIHHHKRVKKVVANSTKQQILEATAKIQRMQEQEYSECPYCLGVFKSSRMQIDHVFPVSRGGAHSAENIILACESCNKRKWSKILHLEWIPPKDRINEKESN